MAATLIEAIHQRAIAAPKNPTSGNICRNSLYWQTHGARGGTYCKTERTARYISVASRTLRMQRVCVCVQLDISQTLAWLLRLLCGPSVNMSVLETAQHACTTHSVRTVVQTASTHTHTHTGVHKTLAKLMLCLVTSLHLFFSSSCAYKDLFFHCTCHQSLFWVFGRMFSQISIKKPRCWLQIKSPRPLLGWILLINTE